jgi:hypothetical protein
MKNKRRKILLVEPDYNSKFPPLGLMKIATAHRLLNDDISFIRGKDNSKGDGYWDIVYISSLFTYNWKKTIDTIKYYSSRNNKIIVGGILASLMPDFIKEKTGIDPIIGPYTHVDNRLLKILESDNSLSSLLGFYKSMGIDVFPPDYGIFDDVEIPYKDFIDENYFLRTSRGCNRKCGFCGVNIIEPNFFDKYPINISLSYINKKWGEKRNLILLDDNILQSRFFNDTIDEIKSLGFAKGAKFGRKKKCVDFNQGLDIRLIKNTHLKKLSQICLNPLRLAFDNIKLKDIYTKKVKMAFDNGFSEINSYLLFNYNDRPEELYDRLMLSAQFNDKYKARIYSFPMKYVPCHNNDRGYIGKYWEKRHIRGVQCILNAFHGIVPTKPKYIEIAFGKSLDEFTFFINMPEDYIIYRKKNIENGKIEALKKVYFRLSNSEKEEALQIISNGKNTFSFNHKNKKIKELLSHYKNEATFNKK